MQFQAPAGHGLEEYDSKPIDYTPAARFVPPSNDDTPQSLFTSGDTGHVGVTGSRFIRHSNQRQILVYADGACPGNGQESAVAGCAFVLKGGRTPEAIKAGIVSFRLEDRGPSGIAYKYTSNRAELRAVIAALQYRAWNGEGYKELVIATDSEYVVKGATDWVQDWVRRGWRTSKGTDIQNRDLWDLLFKEMQKFRERPPDGLRILFWHIPRELNAVADRAAKEAAKTGEPTDSFRKILGVLV